MGKANILPAPEQLQSTIEVQSLLNDVWWLFTLLGLQRATAQLTSNMSVTLEHLNRQTTEMQDFFLFFGEFYFSVLNLQTALPNTT